MSDRHEYDDFWGADADASPVVDTKADGRLYRVPLTRLSPNLVNPRTDFGTKDELIDFGKSLARRQNQPCPVVSRSSYLKLWPEHADRIGEIDYVLVSGERRYRGASAVGLSTLDCVANDDFAKDRKTFMEAVVSENVDRQNFDHIEEAYAVAALVAEFGSNRKVAEHFERVDGWVTQRVCLTYLHPGIQDRVRAKDITLEDARKLGALVKKEGLTAEQQDAWWTTREAERHRAAEERREAKEAAKREAEAPTPAAASGESFTAVRPAGTSSPEQTAAEGARSAVLASERPLERGPDGGVNWAKPADFHRAMVPERPAPVPDPRSNRDGRTPVLADGADADPGSAPEPEPANAPTVEAPLRPAGPSSGVPAMPWRDGAAVMDIAFKAMDDHQRSRLVHRYFAVGDPDTVAAAMRESCSPAEREELASILAKVTALLQD